jgi:hypothetical protein
MRVGKRGFAWEFLNFHAPGKSWAWGSLYIWYRIMLIYVNFKFNFLTKYHSFILNCWRIPFFLIKTFHKPFTTAFASVLYRGSRICMPNKVFFVLINQWTTHFIFLALQYLKLVRSFKDYGCVRFPHCECDARKNGHVIVSFNLDSVMLQGCTMEGELEVRLLFFHLKYSDIYTVVNIMVIMMCLSPNLQHPVVWLCEKIASNLTHQVFCLVSSLKVIVDS